MNATGDANTAVTSGGGGGADVLLKRGNWKAAPEGWAYWATEYNRLLVIEGRHEEVIRLDIISKS